MRALYAVVFLAYMGLQASPTYAHDYEPTEVQINNLICGERCLTEMSQLGCTTPSAQCRVYWYLLEQHPGTPVEKVIVKLRDENVAMIYLFFFWDVDSNQWVWAINDPDIHVTTEVTETGAESRVENTNPSYPYYFISGQNIPVFKAVRLNLRWFRVGEWRWPFATEIEVIEIWAREAS